MKKKIWIQSFIIEAEEVFSTHPFTLVPSKKDGAKGVEYIPTLKIEPVLKPSEADKIVKVFGLENLTKAPIRAHVLDGTTAEFLKSHLGKDTRYAKWNAQEKWWNPVPDGKGKDDEFAVPFYHSTVAHEVGHLIGLNHPLRDLIIRYGNGVVYKEGNWDNKSPDYLADPPSLMGYGNHLRGHYFRPWILSLNFDKPDLGPWRSKFAFQGPNALETWFYWKATTPHKDGLPFVPLDDFTQVVPTKSK